MNPKIRRRSIKSIKTEIRTRKKSIRSTNIVIKIKIEVKTKTRKRRRTRNQELTTRRSTMKRFAVVMFLLLFLDNLVSPRKNVMILNA